VVVASTVVAVAQLVRQAVVVAVALHVVAVVVAPDKYDFQKE
jgi:hypothetical protein